MLRDRLAPQPAAQEARYLSDNPECSVYIEKGNYSLLNYGINPGDILAIDLSLPPIPGMPALFIGKNRFYVDIWKPGTKPREDKPHGAVTGLYRRVIRGT